MSSELFVISLFIGVILSGWLAFVFALRTLQKERKLAQQLKQDTDHLWKFEQIHDAELRATEIIQSAEEASSRINREAERYLEAAQLKSEKLRKEASQQKQEIISEAQQKTKEAQQRSESIMSEAYRKADDIVADARRQAQETAGNALKAVEDAKLYEKTAKAMRNIIEGYHDDYIIPNASLLDDLAEDFSHKDAGQKLKKARQHSRDMAKNGRAGDCDYKEANRREYAMHFAVDAFNGKVDSLLSKVKHDNYGKLKQGIYDAFAVVNHNGMPFKNARVTDLYLQARLEELKWAVMSMELRKEELEEQRAIREQMREEEKARRDIEKARKEAEKQERMLAKAMEEAKKQLESASEAERAEYQARLLELEQQLSEAEARGQRALSMAQQTKRGHVYIISNIGSFGQNVLKIGMTRRLEPMDRVKELGDASVPFSFDVHAMIYSEDAPSLERELHKQFAGQQINRINPRKEFFNVPISKVREVIESEGHEVHWTMKAEAQEYYESRAIAENTSLHAIS